MIQPYPADFDSHRTRTNRPTLKPTTKPSK